MNLKVKTWARAALGMDLKVKKWTRAALGVDLKVKKWTRAALGEDFKVKTWAVLSPTGLLLGVAHGLPSVFQFTFGKGPRTRLPCCRLFLRASLSWSIR